tara:strand:+ start:263 stop:562 length:300 start_codon:yes stop_codon:yes gene_type:complete
MNNTVIKGTPLHISIKTVESSETTGNFDLLPKASIIPMGNDKTIPTPAITRVRKRPPQSLVSTFSRPSPPEKRKTQMIGNMTRRNIPTKPLYFRLGMSK